MVSDHFGDIGHCWFLVHLMSFSMGGDLRDCVESCWPVGDLFIAFVERVRVRYWSWLSRSLLLVRDCTVLLEANWLVASTFIIEARVRTSLLATPIARLKIT